MRAKKKNRGFTLIELLVVIAIIGILAALVLVGLKSARSKANDVAIQSSVSQLKKLSELFYNSNCFSYQAVAGCPSGSKSLETCFESPSSTTCLGGIEKEITTLNADVLKRATLLPIVLSPAENKFCICSLTTNYLTTNLFYCAVYTGEFFTGNGTTIINKCELPPP